MKNNKTKIFIVEDENIVALDIKRYLERNGYIVSGIVSTGEDALKMLKDSETNLVLMDIMLEGEMDGVEAARYIREEYNLPVIFLTAYADDETIERVKITEPFGYLIKPFDERELRTSIEMALYKSKMEKALSESEERYRRFFEDDLSGNFVADETGKILTCNPSFLRIFKFSSREEASDENINNFFLNKDDKERFWEKIIKNRKIELEEMTLITAENKPISVLANVVGTFREEKIRKIKGYLIDITERKRLEEQLRQSQKMDAIGRLAGGVAHDFNNILTVITGYCSLIKDKLKEDIPVENDIEGIQNAAHKAAALTRRLLSFSRNQILKPEVININDMIRDMDKLIRMLILEDISVHAILNAKNPHVFIDPGQMEQVLINLITNARDAMPRGGKLIIETGDLVLSEPINSILGKIPEGNYVIVKISDTGVGIEEELLTKIFEPFFTTKPDEKGTGLGLSTVYGIVNQSKGYLDVGSKPSYGTTFKIYLPQKLSPTEYKVVLHKEDETWKGTETILVVEDEDEVRKLIIKILLHKGYDVLEAKNSGEALLAFEKDKERIDLLITDIIMPYLSGDKLAERLKGEKPDLKILFISGYPSKTIQRKNLFSTGAAFISKPFNASNFLQKVRNILNEK
ncbi:MAG: hybrid sensor histidine kinase/response regulator [Spirochaetes bacterium]|nr:MAG: hybrid sensor histidine kinase/response regulator [Spirochaetota bacterium]